MYASDETQSRLYKIAPSGNMVGLTGLVGSQDGVGTNILLQGVSGLSVDSATGIVYIASTRETSARNAVHQTHANRALTLNPAQAEYVGSRVRRLLPPAQQAVVATAPVCDSTWHHVALTSSGPGIGQASI